MTSNPQMIQEATALDWAREWLDQLQKHGYRLTRSRRAVVETLARSDRSLTPQEIYDIARSLHWKLGLVTVYRTLEAMGELGQVQRVHRPDGCHAYMPAFHGHQHLLLCESCGRVEFFRGDDLGDFTHRLEGESGFAIHEHWLQLFGLCANCQ